MDVRTFEGPEAIELIVKRTDPASWRVTVSFSTQYNPLRTNDLLILASSASESSSTVASSRGSGLRPSKCGARSIADQVRADGREQLLPAMNPVERRIVHLRPRSDPDVTTESQGDGFFKRVAIVPRPHAGDDREP